MEPVHGGGARQRRVDHARLDDRQTIGRVDGQDAIEPVEPEQHHAVGECAS